MKTSTIIISVGLIALSAVCQNAGAQTVLTLEQCREMALENNAKIKNADNAAVAARQTKKEAFTKFFPNVTAAGMAFTTNKGVVQYDLDTELPLPVPLPGITGIPLNVDFNLIKKGTMAGVTLVQPVFVGGQIVNGNKLADVGVAVAELQRQQSRDQVSLTVEQYYWQLSTLMQKRRTLDAVIAMLDTLTTQVAVAVNAGVTTDNDLLEVKLRRNEMETLGVDLDNGISLCGMLLAQYIGADTMAVTIAPEVSADTVPAVPADLYMAPDRALQSVVDYQLLQNNVKASKLRERIAVGKNLPTVGVGAGYYYHNVLEQGHSFGALFVSVAVPISDWWGGSHAIRRSKAQTHIAETELDNYSELLQIKMRNAWDELTSAHRKMVIAHESIAQANENLRLNRNYYQAGTATITDLLGAQTLYRQSRDSFVEAYGNYRVKTAEYLQASGR